MILQFKVLTTIEQTITIDPMSGQSTVISNKIIDTTIVDNKNKVLNPVRYQFSSSNVKYGYLNLEKNNPYRNLYSPGNKVNVSINGVTMQAKWHSSQNGRVDGISKLTSQISDLEARLFKLSYDPASNTLVFDEI